MGNSYIISHAGMSDSERRSMMDFANITEADRIAVANLTHLGISLDRIEKRVRW